MVNCIHEIARGNFYFQVSIVLNYSLNLDFKDKNISSPIEITETLKEIHKEFYGLIVSFVL